MSLESAQKFVSRMKEDKGFRTQVQSVADSKSLWAFVKKEGYDFDEKDLVKAMATCMNDLDVMMQGMKR